MSKIDTLVIAVGGESKRLQDYFKSINFHNTKTLLTIDGQPFLKYLIDVALNIGFRRIFLLASFYEKEIEDFVNNFYDNKNIKVIHGGGNGKTGGVVRVLSIIENELDFPFIYSDGDILFEPKLLKALSEINIDNKIIRCVVSPRDMALTHSKFVIKDNEILDIQLRLNSNSDLNVNYCSMGLMLINNKLFNLLPEYEDLNDLDIVVNSLFKKGHNNIDYKIYNGEWFSIHTKDDIDKINNGNYIKLFRSLKNTN